MVSIVRWFTKIIRTNSRPVSKTGPDDLFWFTLNGTNRKVCMFSVMTFPCINQEIILTAVCFELALQPISTTYKYICHIKYVDLYKKDTTIHSAWVVLPTHQANLCTMLDSIARYTLSTIHHWTMNQIIINLYFAVDDEYSTMPIVFEATYKQLEQL